MEAPRLKNTSQFSLTRMYHGVLLSAEDEHFVVTHVVGGVHVPKQCPRANQGRECGNWLQGRDLHTRGQSRKTTPRAGEGHFINDVIEFGSDPKNHKLRISTYYRHNVNFEFTGWL